MAQTSDQGARHQMGWFKGRGSLSLKVAGTVSKENMEQARVERKGQPREGRASQLWRVRWG